MVVPFSELAEDFKKWKFKALTDEELRPILIEMIKLTPIWCRITRMIRDIPSESILDGCKTINLRQIVEQDMKKLWIKSKDIREREIKNEEIEEKNIEMRRNNYKNCWWEEVFLTFDEKIKDKLVALLRLRIPSQFFTKEKHFIEELEWCALIREIHTYWLQTVIWKNDWNTQHFWFWRKLLAEAEKITKNEYWFKKIAVIAWVWVRKYYEKFWYKKVWTYMVKYI
jgi:elongator complex protein 3